MRFFIVLCCLFVSANTLADMPSTERTRSEKNYVFGDTEIKLIFDSRKDPMGPDFIMEVRSNGRLLMLLNEVAFDHVFASPNNELFVALSNSGWPGSAVLIFNHRGKILLHAKHNSSKFDYCATTSTFMREWYNWQDPQLTFPPYKYGDKVVPGITLKDCYGKTVDLLDVVRKANDQGYRELRQEIGQYNFIPTKR